MVLCGISHGGLWLTCSGSVDDRRVPVDASHHLFCFLLLHLTNYTTRAANT